MMSDEPLLKTVDTQKKRRFLSSDYDYIADYVKQQLGSRRSLQERANHEILWKEVDRQVRMEPPERILKDKDEEWRNAISLGDLSTACEVLSADVLRLIFPQDRTWMQAHAVPVIADITHSLQQPNQSGGVSGGRPEMIETIAKAAIAVGADGLFLETHPNPKEALSDGENMLALDQLEDLLRKLVRIRKAL